MTDKDIRLTAQTGAVLEALLVQPNLSGADLARATKLKSGSLYPILLRLEAAGWLRSEWEAGDPAALGRPRRRFYEVTGLGATKLRAKAREQASLFGRLAWD